MWSSEGSTLRRASEVEAVNLGIEGLSILKIYWVLWQPAREPIPSKLGASVRSWLTRVLDAVQALVQSKMINMQSVLG